MTDKFEDLINELKWFRDDLEKDIKSSEPFLETGKADTFSYGERWGRVSQMKIDLGTLDVILECSKTGKYYITEEEEKIEHERFMKEHSNG